MKIVRSSSLALAFGLGLAAAPAAAQAPDGFLFKQPISSVGLNFGYTVPGANSQIFDFVSEQLTVDRSDFQTVTIGGEFAFRVARRVDIALGLSVSESQNSSEFRDWVDGDDLPIEQVTTLRQIPLTLSAKVYLMERGRSVGSLAWVPSSWAPYVGGGAGLVWFDFQQNGDFVDFETLEVFSDFLQTDGRAGTAHGLAGVDFTLSPRVVLTGEGRYSWGKGDMGQDFVNFDALDLSGFRATAGFKLRF
jgi:opacity protein-like surface antigen